jgi:hypothetical protein
MVIPTIKLHKYINACGIVKRYRKTPHHTRAMTKASSERHSTVAVAAAPPPAPKPSPAEPYLKKSNTNRFSALSDNKNGEGKGQTLDNAAKGQSWADICADGGGGVLDDNDKEEHSLFPLLQGEAPFLVGVKGRNISLIRKFSGMAIYIKGEQVSMVRQRPNANPEMAWRMVLSACYGGILRWFDNPNATKRGYPDENVEYLESIAAKYNLTIDLLRSKRGHMCLMLIPQFSVKSIKDRPTDDQIQEFKIKLQEARVLLLEALSALNPIPVVE